MCINTEAETILTTVGIAPHQVSKLFYYILSVCLFLLQMPTRDLPGIRTLSFFPHKHQHNNSVFVRDAYNYCSLVFMPGVGLLVK